KWYWWRLNGYGYFYGMLAGLAVSVPLFFIDISPLYAFPLMLLACLAACVMGSLFTEPDDIEVLKAFYLRTRPWGAWGPVHQACLAEHPELAKNNEFRRDAFNVVVGL